VHAKKLKSEKSPKYAISFGYFHRACAKSAKP